MNNRASFLDYEGESEDTLSAHETSVPLVFIHGLTGSSLVDNNGKVYWLKLSQAFSKSQPSLALPLEWEENTQVPLKRYFSNIWKKRDALKAGKALDKLGNLFPVRRTGIYSCRRSIVNFWIRSNLWEDHSTNLHMIGGEI